MNKSMIAFCITLLFSLIASVAIAQDLNLNTDTYKMNFERNQVENEKNCALKGVERAGFVDANPDLPYLLHQDQYNCLKACQSDWEICRSSAKGASSINNCDEHRWRCTNSCNNQWYPKLQL